MLKKIHKHCTFFFYKYKYYSDYTNVSFLAQNFPSIHTSTHGGFLFGILLNQTKIRLYFANICNQTEFRPALNQSENDKYNLISGRFNKISLCVYVYSDLTISVFHIIRFLAFVVMLHAWIPTVESEIACVLRWNAISCVLCGWALRLDVGFNNS